MLDPQALPVGALAVDARRRPIWWNDAAARIWRVPAGVAPDLTPGRFLPLGETPGVPLHDPIRGALEARHACSDALVRVIRRDGSPATISVSAAPFEGPDGWTAAVLTVTDVTRRQELEEVRDAFVGILAHEIRTPITSIIGGVGLLRRGDLADDVRHGVVDDLAAETDRLHRLVEDLLVVARLEHGVMRVARDPVLLQHLLVAAVQAERRHWPRHRFEIDVPPDLPPVAGEDGPIEQVVRNLISNGAKYSAPDGLVEVRVSLSGAEVVVTVLDDGPGIPGWAVDEVFGLFYRVPASEGRIPGTGVGLFLSRVIVESLGGRIWVGTRPAGGAEVAFALPVFHDDEGG